MKIYIILFVAHTTVLLGAITQSKGGLTVLAATEQQEPNGEPRYKLARLPISEQTAQTWIVLNETVVTTLPDRAPFGEVMRAIKSATQDGGNTKGVPIRFYIEPVSLQEAEVSMATPIKSPYNKQVKLSLENYLSNALTQLGLVYRVHGCLVVIDAPCDDCPGSRQIRTPEARTWLTLHRKTGLSFPGFVSLRKVIESVERSPASETRADRGLVIHVDPVGLREAQKTLESVVSVELEGVPLCTALGLTLKQLGLGFYVREDGVVVISSPVAQKNEAFFMDETEVAEGYQQVRYSLHHEKQRNDAHIKK